ncbi:unnamed protein product [Brassica oleracea var. botrytis]
MRWDTKSPRVAKLSSTSMCYLQNTHHCLFASSLMSSLIFRNYLIVREVFVLLQNSEPYIDGAGTEIWCV